MIFSPMVTVDRMSSSPATIIGKDDSFSYEQDD